MRSKRRYTVKELSDHHVVLVDHETKTETEYWMPTLGGYVRRITEDRPGTLGWQVCDGLRAQGSTLPCDGRLASVIRREARVAYRKYDYAADTPDADADERLASEGGMVKGLV